MSRRDMKNYSNYRESVFKIENEPEEGEIVDEYDLIVSSDEELCMRQRIRELEAENEEIEQIAVISRSYVDKINPLHTHLENSRAAQVPTDASSISSTEFVTPKKRKRRKSREHKRKHCHHQHQHHHQYDSHPRYVEPEIPQKSRSRKTHCKRRQKLFAKKHQKVHSDRYTYKEINAETVSLDSPESSDSSSSLTDTENYSKNYLPFSRKEDKYISRDTLRLAVARNSNETLFSSKKSCLKDKLLRQELVGQSSNIPIQQNDRLDVGEPVNVHNENIEDEDDDDVQVIENEPEIQTIDEDSTDSMEEKELRLIALKSAVLKKHMARKMRNAEAAYSPTDFDDMLSSGNLQQDNKLDDLEVVDLDAEDSQNPCATASPVASPQLMILDQEESQQMVDCKPIDMDIANSDSDDTTIGSWSKEVEPVLPTFPLVPHDFANNFQYGYYMPDLHELPPPPPGVDDYEDVPPPPPYHKMYTSEMQDMELDNEEISENQHWIEHNANFAHESNQTLPDNISSLPPTVTHKEDVEDEEEEALRALLLSKFQSPKNQKKSKRPIDATESHDTSDSNVLTEQSNTMPKKPTEFILKEAVKRLKIHSQTEHCKEESSSIEFSNPSQPSECNENNSNSLTLLEKLRNRLNKYKKQTAEPVSQEVIQETNVEEKERQEQFDNTIENMPNSYICKVENNKEYQESFSHTSEVSNTIDINAITRRLQQIKENVLSSINKQTIPEPATNLDLAPPINEVTKRSQEIFKVKEFSEEEKTQPVLENITELQKPFHNNLDNIVSTTSELNINNASTKEKTVEANFDATTNQTTFKVTITNSAALKADDSDTKIITSDTSLKENKAINQAKNVKLKVNLNAKNKVAFNNSERLVKIINKTTESSAETKEQVVKPSVVIKPIANKIPVTALPTYPLMRPTKIVKPNKVINTNYDLNRRQISQATETTLATKPTLPESSIQSSSAADNPRLITSLDQVKHMLKVAPFVISVQNSSNESSEDEWGGDYDSLYKPLYDYNDNASPLSLTLESPARTPLRANSPTEPGMEGNTINTDMNKKLDAFLKKTKTLVTPANHQTKDANQGEKTNKTPLAVRHLPAAAQSEYRRLVHRMKLLENKRKSGNVEENTKTNSTTQKNDDLDSEKDKADATSSTPKTSLVKKVLIRNATTTNESPVANGSAPSTKFPKTNVLRSYENLYVKFGAGIVNNLDKSLKLVEEAKKAKIKKLKLETRLKELKAEMDILQSKHKEEQQKISRIYPSICSTNEVITSLKQKRSKVFKAALNLGKTLKGEDYRLNNDLKESITTKSKQLAAEIKIVNSLKAQDVCNMEKALKPSSSTKELTDNKKKTVEDCKQKSNSEHEEIKLNADTAIVSAEIAKEKQEEEDEVENKFENTLQSDVGGNTEFQNMEDQNSKSPVENEDNCRTDVDAKSNPEDSKLVAKEASTLPSYISPLEHLRNIDSNMDPNGVVCPYDLMGNCEDVTCKYVHITPKAKT